MGGFLGLGGDSKVNTGLEGEKNVFNTGLDTFKTLQPAATTTTNSGLGSMDQVKNFFTNIMSGSRPAQFAAVAPEINSTNAQSDAQRTLQANRGTSRGGGMATVTANADTNRMKDIDNMLFGARTGAASEVGKIGGQEANIGIEQLSAALKSLGMSDEAIAHYTDAALKQKQENTSGWGNILKLGSSVFGGLSGLGGDDTASSPPITPPDYYDENLFSPNPSSLG